jgi:hypothetical protein
LIACKPAGDPSVKEESAEGNNERLQLNLGNENSVDESDGKGKTNDCSQSNRDGKPLLGKHPRKSATNEANHRSDGKIDSAGYDDESNPNAYDPKKGRSSKQVLQVVGIQKHVTEKGRGYEDEDKKR